jgi:hypothetical protein
VPIRALLALLALTLLAERAGAANIQESLTRAIDQAVSADDPPDLLQAELASDETSDYSILLAASWTQGTSAGDAIQIGVIGELAIVDDPGWVLDWRIP